MKSNSFSCFIILSGMIFLSLNCLGQSLDFSAVKAGVYFDEPLREWDGFGFNYVETAHTYNYDEFEQEYGGFSLLSDQKNINNFKIQ